MNGVHSPIAAAGTGSWPLANCACFTRLTSPIHLKRPGYSVSRISMPERTDSGRDRSGKVIDGVRWMPAGVFVR